MSLLGRRNLDSKFCVHIGPLAGVLNKQIAFELLAVSQRFFDL